MNEQGLLFDVYAGTVAKPKIASSIEPLSHRDDPQTSREAAELFKRSGKLGLHHRIVLDGVRQCSGATHSEIAAMTLLDWLQVARRLPELERMGFVCKGPARVCRIKQSKCCTWWLSREAGR